MPQYHGVIARRRATDETVPHPGNCDIDITLHRGGPVSIRGAPTRWLSWWESNGYITLKGIDGPQRTYFVQWNGAPHRRQSPIVLLGPSALGDYHDRARASGRHTQE